eukprot:TRINITY_DN32269_c0_g1_i1.p1 TRINITY_DN32269_c0_g1~~TRINITY_DN32269_c0_g1_i1.p1  ORF type:complete len:856 (+),score=285.22 TRINITY_DN32269_c0_g1_i1:254-2569(+)
MHPPEAQIAFLRTELHRAEADAQATPSDTVLEEVSRLQSALTQAEADADTVRPELTEAHLAQLREEFERAQEDAKAAPCETVRKALQRREAALREAEGSVPPEGTASSPSVADAAHVIAGTEVPLPVYTTAHAALEAHMARGSPSPQRSDLSRMSHDDAIRELCSMVVEYEAKEAELRTRAATAEEDYSAVVSSLKGAAAAGSELPADEVISGLRAMLGASEERVEAQQAERDDLEERLRMAEATLNTAFVEPTVRQRPLSHSSRTTSRLAELVQKYSKHDDFNQSLSQMNEILSRIDTVCEDCGEDPFVTPVCTKTGELHIIDVDRAPVVTMERAMSVTTDGDTELFGTSWSCMMRKPVALGQRAAVLHKFAVARKLLEDRTHEVHEKQSEIDELVKAFEDAEALITESVTQGQQVIHGLEQENRSLKRRLAALEHGEDRGDISIVSMAATAPVQGPGTPRNLVTDVCGEMVWDDEEDDSSAHSSHGAGGEKRARRRQRGATHGDGDGEEEEEEEFEGEEQTSAASRRPRKPHARPKPGGAARAATATASDGGSSSTEYEHVPLEVELLSGDDGNVGHERRKRYLTGSVRGVPYKAMSCAAQACLPNTSVVDAAAVTDPTFPISVEDWEVFEAAIVEAVDLLNEARHCTHALLSLVPDELQIEFLNTYNYVASALYALSHVDLPEYAKQAEAEANAAPGAASAEGGGARAASPETARPEKQSASLLRRIGVVKELCRLYEGSPRSRRNTPMPSPERARELSDSMRRVQSL